jgi:hypothetical protein
MQKLLWRGRCRLYFNAPQEAPYIWLLDRGDSTTEIKVIDVKLLVTGFHTMQRKEKDPKQPKVWLERENVAVYVDSHNVATVSY